MWDADNLLHDAERDVHYTYRPLAHGDLVSAREETESNFYHFDAQGSTVALTDASAVETDTTSGGSILERRRISESSLRETHHFRPGLAG